MPDEDPDVLPDLDPNWPPLFGEKIADRHWVKSHPRTLPPRPPAAVDPDQTTLDLDLPPADPPRPRVVMVKSHPRRNPRPKETHGHEHPPTPHRG